MDINQLIDSHTSVYNEIEELEIKAYELSERIREATKDMTKDELFEIYPKIKDSALKFDLFVRIKEGK